MEYRVTTEGDEKGFAAQNDQEAIERAREIILAGDWGQKEDEFLPFDVKGHVYNSGNINIATITVHIDSPLGR